MASRITKDSRLRNLAIIGVVSISTSRDSKIRKIQRVVTVA